MRNIHIHASKAYRVSIGPGILDQVGSTVCQCTSAKKVCIVSDENVWPIYGQTVSASIQQVGPEICSFVFPAGENSKNSYNYLQLLNFLAQNQFTRSDCILALGGGVVGDLAGFAAATYLRGIPYIQVPTTLLAMVDSSVGGKTGIDLDYGKNLVGAFYQPAAVLCDTNALSTLPTEVFRDGCAEVIKYGVLFDQALFAHLEEKGPDFDREAVIARCVELKRDAVQADEFDRGQRKLLNLGHTVGHAVEKCSSYAISHGNAVAVGMAIVSRAAGCRDAGQIVSLLEQFGLPVKTVFSAVQLAQAALSDKKRSGSRLDLIIPHGIGDCRITPTAIEDLQAFIEKGL